MYRTRLRECNSIFLFKVRWDIDMINWKYSDDCYYLARYCHKFFEVWYNEDLFNWNYFKYLNEYCQKHKHLWIERYIIEKLKRGK